jgi:hypothetical protein
MYFQFRYPSNRRCEDMSRSGIASPLSDIIVFIVDGCYSQVGCLTDYLMYILIWSNMHLVLVGKWELQNFMWNLYLVSVAFLHNFIWGDSYVRFYNYQGKEMCSHVSVQMRKVCISWIDECLQDAEVVDVGTVQCGYISSNMVSSTRSTGMKFVMCSKWYYI